jgi:hypothetical protein
MVLGSALPLGAACDVVAEPTDDGIGEGEGEGEGEGAAEAFVLSETVTIDGPLALALPGFALTARPDGRFALAWFEGTDATVTCQLNQGTTQAPATRLVLADEQLDGSIRSRVVDPFVPDPRERAVDLATTPTGELVVAYSGGAVTQTVCGASDLMLAVEDGDGFSIRSVATTAATGTPCRGTAGGDPYCDEGEVVGLYPGVSVNADGDLAIAYMDAHFGFADTDIYSSDLELAFGSPTQTQLTSINIESGAGYFAHASIANDDTVVIGHSLLGNNQFLDDDGAPYVVADGIYAEVRLTDGTVRSSLLLPGVATTSRVATATRAGRGHFVAVHERGDEQLLLFRSVDDGLSWTPAPVEQLGRTGRDPSIMFLDDDTLVLAYGHCRADANQEVCDARADGVRLAVETPAGRFVRWTIPGDAEDLEGAMPHAVVSGAREVLVAHRNTSRSEFLIHRVEVR